MAEVALQKGGIVGRLLERAAGRANRLAVAANKACRHERLSYSELFREVERLAAGFIDLGIRPADHVGLVGENCDLWLITDLALLSIGAVDVPRGGDASADEVAFCVGHARCTAAVVETAAQVKKLGAAREGLRFVIQQKGEAEDGILLLEDIARRGDAVLARDPAIVAKHRESIQGTTLATIIYTSGTTGNPKGVMLTHGNILHNIGIVPDILHLKEGQRYLSFLPSWHSFERTIDYVVLDSGMEIHYSSKWTLRDDFLRVAPNFACGVPRLWETYFNSVVGAVAKLPGWKRGIVEGALRGSRARTDALRRLRGLVVGDDGRRQHLNPVEKLGALVTIALFELPHRLASALVYAKLRAAFGGRVTAMISGGGPLPAHVDEFFTRAGMPLLNGYGLTESSPVISVRRPERSVLGTIGPPCAETSVRVVDDAGIDLGRHRRGVIQAKGPQIMQGYWNNASATELAIRPGGWLDTGDIGLLTDEGEIRITGRAKDTLVLMGGENVEPEPIEAAITSAPVIADALLVGHGKKALGALLVADVSALRTLYGLPKSVPDAEIIADPRTPELLKGEVATRISRRNGYRTFELIGRVHILDHPFSVDDGTLTATLKKKRSVIEARHAQLIASLFEL